MRTIRVLIDHEEIPDNVVVSIPDGMTDEEAHDIAVEEALEEAKQCLGAYVPESTGLDEEETA